MLRQFPRDAADDVQMVLWRRKRFIAPVSRLSKCRSGGSARPSSSGADIDYCEHAVSNPQQIEENTAKFKPTPLLIRARHMCKERFPDSEPLFMCMPASSSGHRQSQKRHPPSRPPPTSKDASDHLVSTPSKSRLTAQHSHEALSACTGTWLSDLSEPEGRAGRAFVA
ncbi:hypothetical protein PYCCODRAFT_1437520 [Trametes coccinea BRFM310]|uniref:Uncharacterized protein n=1 Tax=Trametes coccinea (strain BRFM310) TaxID=1353009 RepID=A0A1Y2IGT9_TRAC3|nr:hypothetical protein PYCCODRAFT_1437520 [Trametes coccinea BRFM310]